jgi:hypothetical protein
MLPALVVLALISLYWFGMAVWVASKGSPVAAYFPFFMGLLFSVAVWFNYRTYRARVAPFNPTPTVLDGLPSFGTYEPGGPPATTGNRWGNWARYSVRMRIVGIVFFGGMILLYDAGGHLLLALNKTPVPVSEAQLPPVTSSPPGDVAVQSDLVDAAATARAVYSANQRTFSDVDAGLMQYSERGNHLSFTNIESPPGTQVVSVSAGGPVATLAVWGTDSDNICWFARVDMLVNGGAPPGGIQFVGVRSGACEAALAPQGVWADEFPPES